MVEVVRDNCEEGDISMHQVNVFYTEEVLEKAGNLNLHTNQEFIRYSIAQSLSKNITKSSSMNLFTKRRKLESSKYLISSNIRVGNFICLISDLQVFNLLIYKSGDVINFIFKTVRRIKK